MISEKNRAAPIKLDEFLRLPVAYMDGGFITVQQIISTSANCFGGIHRGPPKGEEQKAVAEFDTRLSIFGLPFSADAAGHITNTVIEALQPIEAAIKSKGWQQR